MNCLKFKVLSIGFLFLFFLGCKKEHQPQIAFYNVDQQTQDIVLEQLGTNIEDTSLAPQALQINSREELLQLTQAEIAPDMIFFNDTGALDLLEPYLADLRDNVTTRLPRSMSAAGTRNQRRIAYPLQLDHVELALHHDYFTGITDEQGVVQITMDKLEELLQAQVSRYFFPLVVAGKDDQALLDFVSLMTLSMSENQGLVNLTKSIEGGKTLQGILDAPLGNGMTFQNVVDKLVLWRDLGILHMQWYDFRQEDMLTFVEEGLSGAMILRLSLHRQLPLELVKDFTTIPFPQNSAMGRAVDIYSPPLLMAVPENGVLRNSYIRQSRDFLMEDFQKHLTFTTGLGPVNATCLPLDKQASDLRFWAAASKRIATVSPDLNDEAYVDFLDELRVYLKTAR
jgi:hypothetical protein